MSLWTPCCFLNNPQSITELRYPLLTNNTGKFEVLKGIAARMQATGTSILHEMDGIRRWFADAHSTAITEPVHQHTHHYYHRCAHTH